MKKIKASWLLIVLILPLIIVSCEKDSTEKKDTSLQPVSNEGISMTKAGISTQILFQNQKINVLDIGDAYVWQGDILLSKKDIDKQSQESGLKGAGVLNRAWPSGVIYYRVNSSLPNQQRVADAIALVEGSALGVTFVNSTTASNYVEFIDGGGSTYSDWVGYKGGRQVIGLSSDATFGNAAHEILHVLGAFHEQCRTDRDSYIIVNYNNIAPGWESQYYTYTNLGYSGFNSGTFDFNSIMLYSSIWYNGGWSMTTLQGAPFSAQRSYLSSGDVTLVNTFYSPTAMSVSISGPSKAKNSGTYTWSAVTSAARGVTKPYQYKWEYTYDFATWYTLATTQSITVQMPLDLDLNLRLTVTSANGVVSTTERTIINTSVIGK